METLKDILANCINEELSRIIISNPRDSREGSKINLRPVLIQEKLYFQETLYKGNQVFHSNLTREEAARKIPEYMKEHFRQCEIDTLKAHYTVLVSKKGKVTITGKKKSRGKDENIGNNIDRTAMLLHNRPKKYLLEEGRPVEFLVGLGVQTPEGRVVKRKYDKFRQINRYLEFIEDILPELPQERAVRIIDFGCGKSYLTFAMYYYLHEIKGYAVDITGLDLKEDVIRHCNELAEKYGYRELHFELGDISTYEGTEAADMVVTLHACDTATDYAIYKAVNWGAAVIMAVPCCQHEINRQISCERLSEILKYGLIKERMAALVTDAVRANLLEEMGYETQVLEFIDMEHTPKNLMIRAIKSKKMKAQNGKNINDTCNFLNISPTLKKLLAQEQDRT